jgi:hypothetical protein
LFPLLATGVTDRGKFAAGVIDIGGKLPLVLLTLASNLPPVSLTLVAPRYQQKQGVLGEKFALGVIDSGGAR